MVPTAPALLSFRVMGVGLRKEFFFLGLGRDHRMPEF
jgi:hypothetical protein